MTGSPGQDEAPIIRFKRRKVTHPKRAPIDDNAREDTIENVPATQSPSQNHVDDDESALNLREALRNRKRPRERVKEVARKPDPAENEVVVQDAPQQHPYTSRFIAQTGQVVDRDDKQMSKYVEARMAEQNYRKHGWPIPAHLRDIVAEIAPEIGHSRTVSNQAVDSSTEPAPAQVTERSIRIAAGQGKIEEVRIEPAENQDARTTKKERVRFGHNGKPWRPRNRRNSDDIKRDNMVEAILSEAKLDFFDAAPPENPFSKSTGNNDEALFDRFTSEYYEAAEEAKQQQRKPPPPARGVNESAKGPKLGGSKSVRARMRLQEEQAAKTKR